MSNQAAIPAAPPSVFPKSGLAALPNPRHYHSGWYSPSSRVGQGPPRRAAVSADFIGRERDESYVPERVSRSVSRVLFGHGFRACPAPGGSLLFCFCSAALRVTVSLEILFGKYVEKISPDPP
jgi:peptide methionine sulfoxide reductase MsrB